MILQLRYAAQLAGAAGTRGESVEVEAGADLEAALRMAAERHDEAFGRMLYDGDGRLHPTVLVAVDGVMAGQGQPVVLRDGGEILVMTPMAGG